MSLTNSARKSKRLDIHLMLGNRLFLPFILMHAFGEEIGYEYMNGLGRGVKRERNTDLGVREAGREACSGHGGWFDLFCFFFCFFFFFFFCAF